MLDEMLSGISGERGASVRMLGGIPDSRGIHLESRHLGLNMPGETDDLKEQVKAAADLIEEHLDVDALLEIMESGLQYEKTRGNMKETVIEKVEKVFEDASLLEN